MIVMARRLDLPRRLSKAFQQSIYFPSSTSTSWSGSDAEIQRLVQRHTCSLGQNLACSVSRRTGRTALCSRSIPVSLRFQRTSRLPSGRGSCALERQHRLSDPANSLYSFPFLLSFHFLLFHISNFLFHSPPFSFLLFSSSFFFLHTFIFFPWSVLAYFLFFLRTLFVFNEPFFRKPRLRVHPTTRFCFLFPL